MSGCCCSSVMAGAEVIISSNAKRATVARLRAHVEWGGVALARLVRLVRLVGLALAPSRNRLATRRPRLGLRQRALSSLRSPEERCLNPPRADRPPHVRPNRVRAWFRRVQPHLNARDTPAG